MAKYRFFNITLEGIDKTCKNLLASYLWYLSEKNIQVQDRGLISQIAYAKLYNRDIGFDLTRLKNDTYYIFLTTDKKDWEIRCKISNEPSINFEKNSEAFEEAKKLLLEKGYTVLSYSVSEQSIYHLAKQIIEDLQVNVPITEDK